MLLTFSVIIPTLNEGENIRNCIAAVRRLDPDAEVIVADGGSSDETVTEAEQAGARVVSGTPGRGIQCNQGAAVASHDILVFLHADTKLPPMAFVLMQQFFSSEKSQIAMFQLSFDHDYWLLKICSFFTRIDSIWTSFGDRAIIVRKDFYNKMGGFQNWSLFEDTEFLRQARRKTKIYILPERVVTSAKRFLKNGILRQLLNNISLMMQYLLNVPPEELARKYYSRGGKKS